MDALSELAQPQTKEYMGKVVREVLNSTEVTHTEITGGSWQEENGTYTVQESEHPNVTTTYKLIKNPLLRGTRIILTEHVKDGKSVVYDEAAGQWREAGLADKAKQRIESLKTTGYMVQEKIGGEKIGPDGRKIMMTEMRHKLHIVKQNKPIVTSA